MDNTNLCWGFSDEEWLVFLLHCWRGSFTCFVLQSYCLYTFTTCEKCSFWHYRQVLFIWNLTEVYRYVHWKIFSIWAITSKPQLNMHASCPLHPGLLRGSSSASFYQYIHFLYSSHVQTNSFLSLSILTTPREPPHHPLCLQSLPHCHHHHFSICSKLLACTHCENTVITLICFTCGYKVANFLIGYL